MLSTYLKGLHTEIVEIDTPEGITDVNQLEKVIGDTTAAVLVQNPNFFGCIEDMETISDVAHRHDALFLEIHQQHLARLWVRHRFWEIT